MLSLGSQRQRTCQGWTRRAFLQAGGSSVLGLSLEHWLQLQALGKAPSGRARSVILLWLWGGPAQLDTFDPKPGAPLEFRGPFNTIPTRVTGLRFTELFPKIAAITDRIAVIRSMQTLSNDHGVAGTIGLTGSIAGALALNGKVQGGSVRPALGSVVARVRGAIEPNRKPAGLPPFLVIGGKLHQGKKPITGEGGGSLGGLYDPFRLTCDPEAGTRIPALELPPDLTPHRLQDRQRLLQAFDSARRETDRLVAGSSLADYRKQAFALLTSPQSRRSFDLSLEKDSVKQAYGLTRFGQSCLLARRLIEHGVPFVQVNWSDHVEAEEDSGDGGWDHHYRNFQIMQDRHGPWLDQAYSALILDLEARGLLKSTLVLALGEFGRDPKINTKNAGREHWEHCYCALLAGGGVKGGRVIGESDARASRPITQPISPADLGATVQHCIGVTSEMSQTLGIATGGKVVEELF